MTARPVSIRAALDDELDDIAALDRTLFPGDAPLSAKELDAWEWWVAESRYADTIVGYCAAAPSAQYNDVTYLARVGVREAVRGLGLQRRFVRVREHWTLKRGGLW